MGKSLKDYILDEAALYAPHPPQLSHRKMIKLFCKVIKKNWINITIALLIVIISIIYFCYEKRLESHIFNQRYYSNYILKLLIGNYNFHLSNNENVTDVASESWNRFFASHFFNTYEIYKRDQVVIREDETTVIFCLPIGMGVKTSLYILASKETTEYIVLFCYDRINRSPFTMYLDSKSAKSLYVANGLVEIDLQTATYDHAMHYIQTRKKHWQLFAWLDEDMKLHYCNKSGDDKNWTCE
ncbi:MAG: hypothetical protein LBP59_16560 [Planctomycetaceae bacterium]|jgi:hypothetical protein|nr:hypothetical protein [Planctomycetaceae bacterium]